MQDVQLYDGLIGALIGGLLSAGGAFLALWWQAHKQTQSQGETAKSLIYLLFREQERSLNQITEKKAQYGYIAYWDLSVMQANYDVFHRNKEWLVHFKDRNLREEIFDLATELQIWTVHARELQQRYDVLKDARNVETLPTVEDNQMAIQYTTDRLANETHIMTKLRSRLQTILPKLQG